MKLIIDIPEEEVNECKRQVDMIKQEGFLIESLNTALKIHVANGTPLPKGHGRILDEKEILNTEKHDGGWYDLVDLPEYIAGVSAIVEADS